MSRCKSPLPPSPALPIPVFPALQARVRHGMACRMNRTLGLLLATFLGASNLQANFTPAAWQSTALDFAAGANNNWYFYPDDLGNPRILTKATTSRTTAPARKILTGGPPAWTAGTSATMPLISKQGVFVPTLGGGGFLVAPHNVAGVKAALFDNLGGHVVEPADTNAGTYTGVSAEMDSTGRLHLGYIWNGNTICYARRNLQGGWIFTSLNMGAGIVIHDTAVVPITTDNVNLYFCATSTAQNVTTLWRAKPGIPQPQNKLLIQWDGNDLFNVENFVGKTLRGSRIGAVGRLYYFGSNNSNSWTFKLYNNLGTKSDLESAGAVSPKSIHVAFGPDGKQRVAWYNETSKKIHFLKPLASGVDLPIPAGTPVALTGALADPDLLGLHFGPDGTPYILYRRDLNEGFVAFPNDNFDTNGNGRPQILDTAFNSNSAGLEVLPVKEAFPGIANSTNRFKIRFPTIGTANSNGVGGIQTSTENLLYKVEVSPDLVNWTPLSPGSAITYTATSFAGALKTYVGVINETAPGVYPNRFARLAITRLNYPY